ncbi:MAG: DUF4097 family beta strand repeat-containing protein, partial [Promethearchaeota archaeon]
MKRLISAAVIILFVSLSLNATEYKKLKKSFKVDPNQRIEIESISGLDVKVKSWDKNEVLFDLSVKVRSSDKEYEKAYVEALDIIERRTNSDLIIEFVETSEEGSWSFWDIFELKFGFSIFKEIKGNIYVPKANDLEADFRYSNIQLEDMSGELNLNGRANELMLNNCSNIKVIENNYGDVTIKNCGGNLDLESRSSNISVEVFDGPAKIYSSYSNIKVYDISNSVEVDTRSADVKIKNINGDLKVNADYSDVEINDVSGFLQLVDRSGNVWITNAGGIKLEGPYTDFEIKKITGVSYKKIEIKNKSGKIKLEDAVGDILITDSYSSIGLKSIVGNVELTSRSAPIYCDNIQGDWVSDTKYSKISIKKLSADKVVIDNRSENVTLQLEKVPDEIEIDNEYGDVDLTIPKGFAGNV